MPETSKTVVIRTLMGAGNLDLSLKCLGSIKKYCRHPLSFHVHEDGTIDAALRERLREALGPITFQDKKEADALMAEKLRQYPNCRTFREGNIYAIQLLDIPLLAPAGQRIVHSDTDILYTRPLVCPDFFLGGGLPYTGSNDLRESYSVPLKRWVELPRFGVKIASRLCGGMMSFEPHVHDLDFVERLLKLHYENGIFSGFQPFIAQTIYAALAARVERGCVDPKECVLAHNSNIPTARQASIIHFAGYSRNYFQEIYAEIIQRPADGEPRRLGIQRVPICGLSRRWMSAARTKLFHREDPLGVR